MPEQCIKIYLLPEILLQIFSDLFNPGIPIFVSDSIHMSQRSLLQQLETAQIKLIRNSNLHFPWDDGIPGTSFPAVRPQRITVLRQGPKRI